MSTRTDALWCRPNDSLHLVNQYRGRIDAQEVLYHYGANRIIRDGDELVHSCLIDRVEPHHASGDRKPSAAMNEKSLLYSCFAYGGGDLLWFIRKMEGLRWHDPILPYLEKFFTQSHEQSTEEFLAEIDALLPCKFTREIMPVYSPRILDAWAWIHPYLTEERGLSEEVICRYQIGYDEKDNKIVIPHFWHGDLVGWQKRKMNSPRYYRKPGYELDVKYVDSPQFPKKRTFYNFDTVMSRRESIVVIVESALSVLKAETWGETNVLSPFSARCSREQINILKQFSEVVIFLDDDIAGWRGALLLCRGLYRSTKVIVVVAPHTDPDDMTHDQYLDHIKSAVYAPLALIDLTERIQRFDELHK
jgi:DNA primase